MENTASNKNPLKPLKPFYLTCTLPYVNAEPHIGFALEIVRGDIIVRYKALRGHETLLNTGADEHGLKIYRKAAELGMTPQKYTDEMSAKLEALLPAIGVQQGYHFVRTTSPAHVAAATEFWKRCAAGGFIYKKNYSVKYCVGCELEKTDSELEGGKCPVHPQLTIEEINEENYFFKFSAFGDRLLELYKNVPDFVVPDFRLGEIRAFVGRGLEDFSISRVKSKMPWGVPVPGDDEHVMYVWFDALVSYISALGWPETEKGDAATSNFQKWWPVTQYCGKDNLRQQSAMWQAMLMAAGLPCSRQIVVNGFVTGEGGIKMSKSLGNVINPKDIIVEYGAEPLRYFLAAEISSFEDSPFTMEIFKSAYNAKLANGLGNLASRIMQMAISYEVEWAPAGQGGFAAWKNEIESPRAAAYRDTFDTFHIQDAAAYIWDVIAAADKYIQKEEPFKKVKVDREGAVRDVQHLQGELWHIAALLDPIMPQTAVAIRTAMEKREKPMLFPRKG